MKALYNILVCSILVSSIAFQAFAQEEEDFPYYEEMEEHHEQSQTVSHRLERVTDELLSLEGLVRLGLSSLLLRHSYKTYKKSRKPKVETESSGCCHHLTKLSPQGMTKFQKARFGTALLTGGMLGLWLADDLKDAYTLEDYDSEEDFLRQLKKSRSSNSR